MTSMIKWNDEKMSIGIASIDAEHKKLLDLINKIIESIEHNHQMNDIDKFIEAVFDYVEYHFKNEEQLFVKYNISESAVLKHQEDHQEFKNMANSLYYDIKENKNAKSEHGIELVTKLYNFLINWLLHHIVVEDKKIFC